MELDRYIEIDKDDIPNSFEIDIADETFTMEFHYNESYDFFTVDLFKDDEPLWLGEKLILNQPLFVNCVSVEKPNAVLIPIDRADNETRITFENLSKTVFLYVLAEGEIR